MSNLNVTTWNRVYSEGRSLLEYPDESIVSYLTLNRGKFRKGLDIACGAGRHTFLMREMGIEAYGIDSSDASINFAKDKAVSRGIDPTTFKKMLAQDVSYEKESFDLIIVWGLFHYLKIEDQKELLSKVYSFLRPGGTLLSTLRSELDTRAIQGEKVGENQYLANYFDEETSAPKQTLMYLWDLEGVHNFFGQFSKVDVGHRVIEPIGKIGIKTAHWLIAASK